MSVTRVVVSGAAGKMGRAIIQLLSADVSYELAGALEHQNSSYLGIDAGVQAGVSALGVKITENLPADQQAVVIEFSSIAATLERVESCVKNKMALVIGTTGFNAEQKKVIVDAAKKIPIVMSPNMSIGVNVMLKLVADAAKILGKNYDIEITEIHHRHKIDAPSGTAMGLADSLCLATGRNRDEDLNYHRQGHTGPRSQNEIGMQVLRGGDVVGDHTVHYFGEGERLEIRHVATSRNTFASGALRAAAWLSRNAKPGLYNMSEVLGI